MASPQKENGYTAVANEILEKLVKTRLLGSEYQILFFLLRKTYGFQKKQDIVSLSQFQKGTELSRPTVVKTIKNLITRNMIVKICLPHSRIAFSFNKNYDSWVVNTSKLVKGKWVASKHVLTENGKDVLTHKRNKETNTKEIATVADATGTINEFISLFKEINPSYEVLFSNRTQRGAAERLLKSHGIEAMRRTLSIIEKTNEMQYAPVITTPLELEKLGGKLKAFIAKEKTLKVKNKIITV